MRVGILTGIVFVLQVHLISDTKDNLREAEESSYLFFSFYEAADLFWQKYSDPDLPSAHIKKFRNTI
jgi:hypothetical protein